MRVLITLLTLAILVASVTFADHDFTVTVNLLDDVTYRYEPYQGAEVTITYRDQTVRDYTNGDGDVRFQLPSDWTEVDITIVNSSGTSIIAEAYDVDTIGG